MKPFDELLPGAFTFRLAVDPSRLSYSRSLLLTLDLSRNPPSFMFLKGIRWVSMNLSLCVVFKFVWVGDILGEGTWVTV